MRTLVIRNIEFDVEDTDNFDVTALGNGEYTHSWDFEATVDGIEMECRHTIHYSKTAGVTFGFLTLVGTSEVIESNTEEFKSQMAKLNEAAKVNIEYYIDNIECR